MGEYKMYYDYEDQCPYCMFRTEHPNMMGGMHGGPQGGAPMQPPPMMTPNKNHFNVQSYSGMSPMAIDSGAIRPCRNRYVYIWLRNGESFWAWLNYVGRRSVSGWRWNGRRWVFFGTDLRRIDSFICM